MLPGDHKEMVKIYEFKLKKKDHFPGSISIIIPTPSVNSKNFKKCLSHLYNSNLPEYTEVFAVVSSGSDFNLSRSVNIGMTAAPEDRDVILLNDDCFVEADTIQNLMETKRTDDGILGCVLRLPDGRPQHLGGFAIVSILQYLKWGLKAKAPFYVLRQLNFLSKNGLHLFEPYHRITTPATTPLYVTGALVLIPRTTIQTIGVFDENFKNGYEDLDYCISVWNANLKVRLVENSSAVHKNHDSLGPNRENIVTNLRYLQEKWGYDYLKKISTDHREPR